MTHKARQLLEEALALPENARLQLAARLLESAEPADGTPEEVEAAWAVEIRRRLASHRTGKGKTVDAFAALAKLQSRLPSADAQRRRRRQ